MVGGAGQPKGGETSGTAQMCSEDCILLCLPPPAGAQGMAPLRSLRSAFLFLLHSFQASAISTHYGPERSAPTPPVCTLKIFIFCENYVPFSASGASACPCDGYLRKQQSFFKAQLTCHLLSKAFSHSLRHNYLLPPVTPHSPLYVLPLWQFSYCTTLTCY